MKKISFLAIAVLAVSAGAFAQGPKDKKAKAPKELPCPVMTSHKVDIAKATASKMYADYKGKRYFFCCGMCKPQFEKNPAKYAKAASIPTPKVKKG